MNSYVHKPWNPNKNEVWSEACVTLEHKIKWDQVASSIKSMMFLSMVDNAYETQPHK